MPTTSAVNAQLYNLGREVSHHYHELQDSRRRLEKEADKLMHRVIRLEVPGTTMFDTASVIHSRDPGVQGQRWSDRYGDPSRSGTFERVPVVGVVIGYEIGATGGVKLIFVIPGRKKEYLADPEHFEVEVLDSFPEQE